MADGKKDAGLVLAGGIRGFFGYVLLPGTIGAVMVLFVFGALPNAFKLFSSGTPLKDSFLQAFDATYLPYTEILTTSFDYATLIAPAIGFVVGTFLYILSKSDKA